MTVPPDSSRWLSVAEAARLKGVLPATIRRAIREGRLAASESGGIWLICPQALDRWQPRTRKR